MKRVKPLISFMEKENLDALFLVKRANVNYVSGFSDEASYVILTKSDQFFITDGRFYELAQKECVGFNIIEWRSVGSSVIDAVKKVCDEKNIKRLGFERTATSFDMYDNLAQALAGVELVATTNVVEELRYIKDDEEIEILREASRITDKSFEEVLNYIKPGMTENEVAARLEYIMKMQGAGIGFETILISGKKTSLPHGKPDGKVIEKGDFITLDFGAMIKGYTSDMTRTIVVGEPDEKQKEVYNLVLEAQVAALGVTKAGVTAKDPDDVIRKIIKKYEEFYYPGIGHGVGRELHEQPFLGIKGTRIIEKNCVITMEPGLYIPNWGGVRIEDTILVKEDGVERLTVSSKELTCV